MLTWEQICDEEPTDDCQSNPEMSKPMSKIFDRFGNRFVFANAGDIWLPPLAIGKDNTWQGQLKRVKEFPVFKDDVFICSYPKTGLHWTMEMVSMLTNHNTDYSSDMSFYESYLEINTSLLTSTGAKGDSSGGGKPRILHTHLPFRYLPRQVLEKKVKVICLIRNPKDALTSFYCQNRSFRAPFNFAVYYGNIFEYLMGFQDGWDEHPDVPVLTCVFEDMKRSPLEGVRRINAFLGTDRSEAFCQQVSNACAFKQVQKHKGANESFARKHYFRENADGFYRKGTVGDWKNMFTVALNEVFDEQCKNRMEGYRTEFQYE